LFYKKIKFISPFKGFILDPKPASAFIPKEYKNLKAYLTDSKKYASVKKCIPFLDAYSLGYIIPCPIDIEYRPIATDPEDGKEQPAEFAICPVIPEDFLPFFCVTSHMQHQTTPELRNPKRTIDKVFKFANPWKIKTPPGYSSLIISPLNHNLPFDLISGVVDTDRFDNPILFPFYWTGATDKPFLLKKGTPWVHVIPFKREAWKMETDYQDAENFRNDYKRLKFFSTIADNYKNLTWIKKTFK
jgi:hypothetical protein